MKRSTLFWILACIVTAGLSYYQRTTGPTYAFSTTVTVENDEIPLRLDRSHAGSQNALVEIEVGNETITGVLLWTKYGTDDPWIQTPMVFEDGKLRGELPHQPPMGKLEYKVVLAAGEDRVTIPAEGSLMMRFKDDVPLFILLPHVLVMLGSLLLAARTGLEYFSTEPKFRILTLWTVGFVFVGGFILGPLATKFAFDLWWTGWPVGNDITDNKTIVALVAWLIALVAVFRARNPKGWVLGAALVMILVFLIPHSILTF